MNVYYLNNFPETINSKEDSEIIVITSVINPTNVQSTFTSEERLNQTLLGISSVKKYIPHAIIILAELTELSNEQIDLLKKSVDYVILLVDDVICQTYGISNKSIGEALMLNSVCQKIKSFPFKRFYKMSGRYICSDNFDLKEFQKDKMVFKIGHHDKQCYITVFYSIPKNLFELYILSLGHSRNYMDIEHGLYYSIPNECVSPIEAVNCEGYLGGGKNSNGKLALWKNGSCTEV